jgi:hypothetical protein
MTLFNWLLYRRLRAMKIEIRAVLDIPLHSNENSG